VLFDSRLRRTRSRRRLLVWLILLTVVTGTVLAIDALRSERRRLREYFANALRVAETQADVAGDLNRLLVGIGTTQRASLRAVFVEGRSKLAEAGELLTGLAVPAPAGVANGYLRVAHESWTRGLDGIETSLLELADQGATPVTSVALEAALLELKVGDHAYAAFRSAAPAANPDRVEFASISFLPDGIELDRLTASAVAATGLKLVHDPALAPLRIEPRPVQEPDGTAVIPNAEEVLVQVTISNQGNESEDGLTVRLDIQAGVELSSQERRVDSLAPGISQVLDFKLAVRPGTDYRLVALLVSPSGDGRLDNNSQTATFAVRST